VKTLGPFALDPLRARWRDPGDFTYKVQTKAEGEIDFIYDLPDPLPDPPPDGDQDTWELYQAYLAHERRRRVIAEGFERDAMNLAMLNCFDVLDGPISWDDDDWLDRLSPFLDELPESRAERMVLFRKTQVFAIPFEEWAAIRQITIAPEVNLEGLLHALEMFRVEMGWGGAPPDMGYAASGETEPQHAGLGDPGGGDAAP
jgi:hypothetical protein